MSVSLRAVLKPCDLLAPLAVVLLASVVVWGCRFAGFDYDGSTLNFIFGCNLFVCAYGLVMRVANKGSRIGEAMQNFCLFCIMSLLSVFATAVVARAGLPYIDDRLEAMDRALFPGVDWVGLNLELGRHPWVMAVLSQVYASLGWQPLVLFGLMLFRRSNTDMPRFMAAWSISLLGCILPFAFLPARGAYVHFGIPFESLHGMTVHQAWEYPVLLEHVRDGSIHTLGLQSVAGLVTMPSFHACAATLLGWGFRKVPVLGGPFVALNVLMFISAVPVGGHYLVDLVAGLGIAMAAIALADRLQAWPAPAARHGQLVQVGA